MAPGKTYDVTINVPAAGSTALPIFDREGSLSGNARERDAGMLAYISINGAAAPNIPSPAAIARDDTYNPFSTGQTLTVSDPMKGVIANDSNVYGVTVTTAANARNSEPSDKWHVHIYSEHGRLQRVQRLVHVLREWLNDSMRDSHLGRSADRDCYRDLRKG